MALFRSLMFFITILSLSTFSSSYPSSNYSKTKKVSVDLYYETLCPYCSSFIVNYLAKLFDNGLISVVDLGLIPYGNARMSSNGTVTCQHGPNECLLNTIEACAIHTWPDLNKHFRFIYCVELLVTSHNYKEWESCFEKTGLSSEAVLDCYKNGKGVQLILEYAEQTNSLKPPHKYVPWVVVNGQPLYEDYEDVMAYICKAYEGKPPQTCNSLPFLMSIDQKANRAQHVSLVYSSAEN